MSSVTNSYETIFIVDLSQGEEAMTATLEKFKALIAANGTIETVDEWGKRKLAYEINDLTDGYYVLIHFTSGPDFPAELDRVYKITDGILRSIIIRKNV